MNVGLDHHTSQFGRVRINRVLRVTVRDACRDVRQRWPFRIDLHAIWTLPQEDADYSNRWAVIKKHFAQSWLVLGGPE